MTQSKALFAFVREFQVPFGQHVPVEDANDQKAVLIELVEHNMTPLLGASVARTNVVARAAKEQYTANQRAGGGNPRRANVSASE